MCGRMTQDFDLDELSEACLEGAPAPDLSLRRRYNGCPGQDFVVCRTDSGRRTLGTLRWGLVPAVPPSGIPPPINARAETVHHKATFRESFRRTRCVAPIRGWFEWRRKQPYFIHAGGAPIFLAGIEERGTFAVLTTRASEALAEIHHRQPAALTGDAVAEWLDPDAAPERLLDLARTPKAGFGVRPVSARVNSPRNDGPDLLDAVRRQPALF